MIKEEYSINEVATMTGLTTRTIRNYLSAGQIKAGKKDGKWVFSADDFYALLDNPFVEGAIKIKDTIPVMDFLKDEKKKEDSVCLIIDRKVSIKETEALCEKICELQKIDNQTNLRLFKKDDRIRIVLSGSEASVKKIYLEI